MAPARSRAAAAALALVLAAALVAALAPYGASAQPRVRRIRDTADVEGVVAGAARGGKRGGRGKATMAPTPVPTLPPILPTPAFVTTSATSWTPGQTILSLGACKAAFNADGSVAVTSGASTLWRTPAYSGVPAQLVLDASGEMAILDAAKKTLWSSGRPLVAAGEGGVVLRLDATCLLEVDTVADHQLVYSPFFLGRELRTPPRGHFINMTTPYFFADGQCRAVFEGGDLHVVRVVNATTRAGQFKSFTDGQGVMAQMHYNGTFRVAGPYNADRKDLTTLWRANYYTIPVQPIVVGFDASCNLLAVVAGRGGGMPTNPPSSAILFNSVGLEFNADGGQIATNLTVFPFFWGEQWKNATFVGDRISTLEKFYKDLDGSTYLQSLNEYMMPAGTKPRVFFGQSFIDPTPTPTAFTNKKAGNTIDLVTANRVCAAIKSGALNFGGVNPSNAYVPVYLDLKLPNWSPYCAFHESLVCVDGKAQYYSPYSKGLVFGFGFFWNFENERGCLPPLQLPVPGRSAIAAGLADASGHELIESMSDIRPASGTAKVKGKKVHWNTIGWLQPLPPYQEISDICTSLYAYVKLGTDTWALQSQWSNAENTCTFGPGTEPVDVIAGVGAPTLSPVPAPTRRSG